MTRSSFYDPAHDRRTDDQKARDCRCTGCTLARFGIVERGTGADGAINYALLCDVFATSLAWVESAIATARGLSLQSLSTLVALDATDAPDDQADAAERRSDETAHAHARLLALRDDLELALSGLERQRGGDGAAVASIASEQELDELVRQLLGRS